MPGLHSPQFVGLALLGLLLFLLLINAGKWSNRRREAQADQQAEPHESVLFKEVPWYGFAAVYVGTIAILLYVLTRFVGY